jgi:long-chain acyl-CoA synthetase
MFFDAVDRYGDMEAQRYKGGIDDRSLVAEGAIDEAPDGEYVGMSFDAVGDVVRRLATGFRELGVEPDDRVGIYGDTRMEWAQSDFALQSAGAVTTTVYTESSTKQVRYLLDDPGATGVVVEDAELLETIGEVEDDLDLELVVVMEDVDDEDRMEIATELHTLGEVWVLGDEAYDDAAFEGWLDERELEDLSSLVYTSGTTGQPKGVELTHWNWRSCVNQVRKRTAPRPDKPDDVPVLEAGMVGLSILPLAHAFERWTHYITLASGMTLAYAESVDTVADDVQKVKPDAMAAVPRVYERVYDRMREQASESPVKQRVFEWAVDVGQAFGEADDPGLWLRSKHAIADRLVYSTVRETLGGELDVFVSGGGSLARELAQLYRAMDLTIVNGYGLTETAPVLTTNPPEANKVGTMGPAIVDVDIAVDPRPVSAETRDTHEGDVGELLARGPNVFGGYWGMPEKTEEVFTDEIPEDEIPDDPRSEGPWFRTGDIVARDDDGYFSFVDRLKNVIVLDTGKNIAPEPIEDEFATSDRVDQIMVVGDDEKFVAALVKPNFDALRRLVEDHGIDVPTEPQQAVGHPRVRAWIEEAIQLVNMDIAKHEQIKEFRLVADEWTPDNDMLTPSMKKKRRNIEERHAELLDDIYREDDDVAD